jgi:hypothetical protein
VVPKHQYEDVQNEFIVPTIAKTDNEKVLKEMASRHIVTEKNKTFAMHYSFASNTDSNSISVFCILCLLCI